MYLSVCSLSFGFGLYICTLTLSFSVMTLGGIAGFAGILGVIWYQNIIPLFFATG